MQASIQSRLAGAMREQGMRSLLLADPENFGYVAGPMLPYVKQTPDRAVLALFEPGTDEAACTCWLYPDLAQPAEAQLAKEPSAVCVAVAEDAVGADCLIRRLKESRPDLDGVVGVDFSQTAASVFDALRAAFPGCSFKDAGPMLRGLRLVKLPEEIDRIEMACRQVDTGIIGAINHMEGAHSGSAYRKGFYTVPEFIERVRIHAYEGGTSMSGNMAAVAGEAIGANYMPQRGFLPSEGLCRIEYACCHGGYWGVTARMIHIGEDMDPRTNFIGDLAELLEIDDPCIGTGTGYDQFRMTFVCDPSDFFVIDHAVIVYAIRYNVKICTGKICRASVCQMSAVCKVHAHHGISRL